MRALVPNPDGVLKPGEFVRVVVVFPDVRDAVLVPQRAVLDQQGGTYVLVVKDDDTVESRRVTLGAAHDGMQQITDGLAAGERVIVDGVQKARPGQKVVAKPAPHEAGGARRGGGAAAGRGASGEHEAPANRPSTSAIQKSGELS